MLSNFLIVLAAGVLSMALRSYRHPFLHRMGTIGIFATSFLAGWLIGGNLLIGAAFAASWLLLPWLEILTRVRKLRLPIERRLEPRTPPNRSNFPNLNDLTQEIEDATFEQLEDIGWEHDQQQQFYRLFYHAASRTEAALCLVEQNELAFYYISLTSRNRDGKTYTTWNYPFSYSLRIIPRLEVNRVHGELSFSQMLSDHHLFLDSKHIDIATLDEQTADSLRVQLESDMRDQIIHNIKRGLLKKDGENFIRYSARGMLFLWVQFLRDLVRLS